MKKFVITYTLREYQKNYSDLYAAIKKINPDGWYHPIESAWFIKTDDSVTANDMFDKVKSFIGGTDIIVISEIKDDVKGYAGSNFWKWIKEDK